MCGMLLLILLAVGIGFLLPEQFEGSHTITVPQPREAVWQAVRDYTRYPVAGANTRAVEQLGPAERPEWREDLDQASFIVRTVDVREPAHLVREIRGVNMPLDARFTVELLTVGEGTKVTATQRVTVSGVAWEVPFSRLIHFFGGAERWALDYLEFLERGLGAR